MFLRKPEEEIKQNLEKAVQSGASLYLEGKTCTPEDIARHCVNEEMSYMADYVWNEKGKLTEIRYDKIQVM